MADFTIGDFEYKSGTLPAFSQFHIIQRLGPSTGPFVRQMLPALDMYRSAGLRGIAQVMMTPDLKVEDAPAEYREIIVKGIDALGQALGSLSDEASEYIIGECLAVTQRRKVGSGMPWADLWNKAAKGLQFQDMKPATMLRISWIVMRENLSSFFLEMSSTQEDG